MSLVNPSDTIERQNEKLMQIAQSLMRRVEQKNEQSGLAYQQFERAALLETEVRERTHDLERALDLLQESNTRLEIANDETERARSNLTEAIETINEGFALFEPVDGLVLSNSRFCRDLTDVAGLLVGGLQFEDYVKLISGSGFLALPEGQTRDDWIAQRLERHGDDHVVFNVRLKWDRWLQVSEHRTSRGGTVILQTDVTSIIRRERQERARMRDKQAEILQATLDHLNQGVCIFDSNQTLVGWNSRMDGLFKAETHNSALGMSFNVLLQWLKDGLTFDATMDAAELKAWANRASDRKPIMFEVNRDNTQTFSVFAQEMPDRGFVISFTDVTAERATARRLFELNELLEQRVEDRTRELGLALAEAERANASKSRFVAAASHDLLQPLSAAKLFLSSLSEESDPAQAKSITEKAEMALASVEQFIAALLDISKLDAGKAVFDVQPLRLSEIFEPLRNELMPIAQQKRLDLRIVDCGLTVESDPGYLRRIVQNLLTNAIRYTAEGRVLVGVRRTGRVARIEVWDTGRGIAQEDQQTIFREFERLSPDNADAGLGLGLSIVERACKGLDHAFGLWSEPGLGSCFSLNVPISEPDVPAIEVGADTAFSAQHVLSDQLLMLVEDNPQLAQAITAMVEGFGTQVIHAHTAEEALAILQEIQLVPDAMLIDYQLGAGQNGADLLQDITQRYGHVPAAIISAERTKTLRDRCKTLGIQLVAKPIEKTRLRHLLVDLFTSQGA
ncbi:PAS-domain containing protein [Tateyamaria sp. SN3-11]|uniref:hybrid sensor histidine kinase/response regulator n=1 Tax=Tateyamaria sp. SN3-11 TaxID=3092147 RepID=UPI0039E90796